jgi:hypothetical protein
VPSKADLLLSVHEFPEGEAELFKFLRASEIPAYQRLCPILEAVCRATDYGDAQIGFRWIVIMN